MYSVGDKVVHPGYGPGVITGIERRQMVTEAKRYYVINMIAGGGTLMTPVARADKVGLRPAIGEKAVKRLLRSLTEEPGTLSGDFRERQFQVEELLKEGDVFTTAQVLRDLAWHDQVHSLTKRDLQLMQRAEELLAGEVALVEGIEIKEAVDRVHDIVTEAMRKRAENETHV